MSTLSHIPELFDGYDSFEGEALGGTQAVSGNTVRGLNGSSTNTVSVCTDADSVTSAISVSGSVSDVSASAKASWVQSLSITSTSVVVVVHTIVQSYTQADGYALAVTAPTPADLQTFFSNHGDSWVSELLVGAEYYAAFVYDSTSVEQQQQITTQLSGSAGDLSASLSTTLNNTASSTKTSMRVNQQLLGPTNLAYPAADADSIVSFALDFNTQITDSDTALLAFGVTGYEETGVTGFDAVVHNRNLLGTGSVSPFADALSTLNALLSQIQFIQKMYEAYDYTSDSAFSKKAGQVITDLQSLNALIAEIEQNVTGTYAAPQLPSLQYGTPLVTYAIGTPIYVGGSIHTPIYSTAFDLDATQIASGVKAVSVMILSGGFQVTYSDGTVLVHGSGTPAGTVTIGDNDSISLVGFEVPTVVMKQIETAKGQSAGSSGPLGYANAPPLIIGFAVQQVESPGTISSAGDAMNITMSPAVWVHPTSS